MNGDFSITLFCCILCMHGVTSQDADGPRGGSLLLECNHGQNAGTTVIWYYYYTINENNPVTSYHNDNHADYGQWSGRTDIVSSAGDLTINNLTFDDDGEYTCTCGVFEGSPHMLTITVEPTTPLMSGLVNDWVIAEEDYLLTCVVEEVKPLARIYWVIDGDQLFTVNNDRDAGTGEGIKTVTGTLTHLFTKDPGVQQVTCRVTENSNPNNILREDDYKVVNVYYAPTTSVKPTDGQGPPQHGSQYSLLCEVTDGRPAPGSSDNSWWRGSTALGERSNTLTQTLDRTQHAGTYTCVASNTAGTGSSGQGFDLTVNYTDPDPGLIAGCSMFVAVIVLGVMFRRRIPLQMPKRKSADRDGLYDEMDQVSNPSYATPEENPYGSAPPTTTEYMEGDFDAMVDPPDKTGEPSGTVRLRRGTSD